MDLVRRRNARRIGSVEEKEGIPKEASTHKIVVGHTLPSCASSLFYWSGLKGISKTG